MPKLDITNPAVIVFLKECYDKENRDRVNWVIKHGDKLQQAATLSREPTNYYETDVFAHNMVEGLATTTRDHVVAGYNRRKSAIRDGVFIPGVKHLKKGYSIVDIGLGNPKEDPRLIRPDTDTSKDPIMRPVDPKLTEIIYKHRPEFGRDVYLEKRKKICPEARYYFNECTNWNYGWRLRDTKLREMSKFGRCWHLTRALQGRVGPQPDPSHYKSLEMPGSSKCIN